MILGQITIELRAGRGVDGYTATLDIVPRDAVVAAREAAPVVEETKAAEPKPVTKATLAPKTSLSGLMKPKAVVEAEAEPKKPSGLLLKAHAEAEAAEAADGNPETAPQAYTGEDDGADDEVTNTMVPSSRDDEAPMNEAPASPPRSIFSKVKAG
jgi:hypothetical protein